MGSVIDEFNPQEWEIANENEVEGTKKYLVLVIISRKVQVL